MLAHARALRAQARLVPAAAARARGVELAEALRFRPLNKELWVEWEEVDV